MLKKRILAYLIDMMVVAIIMNIIGIFMMNSNTTKLNEELDTLNNEVIDRKISEETYINRLVIIEQDMDKENLNTNIIELMLVFGYFVVVPFCFNGQTIGKKVFKIKIKAKNGDLTINSLLIRTLMIDGLSSLLVCISTIYLVDSMPYFIIKTGIRLIELVILIVSVVKIKNTEEKQGLHDRIAKTEVVEVN